MKKIEKTKCFNAVRLAGARFDTGTYRTDVDASVNIGASSFQGGIIRHQQWTGEVLKFTAIISKFPEQELAIHRLCSQNDDFLTACVDFEDATKAFRHWEKAGAGYAARTDEYQLLVRDLEAEILESLKACGISNARTDD